MKLDQSIVDALVTLGLDSEPHISSVGGGCISEALKVSGNGMTFFVKIDQRYENLHAEHEGLKLMFNTHTIKVPKPLACGRLASKEGGFLICEFIQMSSLSREGQKELGRKLAEMHLASPGDSKFGLHFDNSCGSTPQINTPCDDWVVFFGKYRLQWQCESISKQYRDAEILAQCNKLVQVLPAIISTAGDIKPSLIHGDLWSGNASGTAGGSVPVIFDGCPYYAHSEMELGMMDLFGGFTGDCMREYHRTMGTVEVSKSAEYKDRIELYKLYHVLNHYNIFGSGYRSQAMSIMAHLIERYS